MVSVRALTGEDREDWNDHVARAPHASPFHRLEALELLANLSGSRLHLLAGYKGQAPVGLLPLFEDRVGPLRTAVTPPAGTEVYYLGVALADRDQLKRRKLERRNRRFVAGALDWLDAEVDPDLTNVRTVDRYPDLRPFKERGFAVTPYYTYVVDLSRGEEALLASFSSDARSNVRTDADYEIVEGDADDCARIVERVAARHAEQGEPYHLTTDYVRALYRRLPEGTVRPYVCRVGGDPVGGLVALEWGDTVYRWQGGTKVDADVPVNDLLDWHAMREGKARGATRYDLVGANQYRLTAYKAKFGGDLVTYHRAIRRTPRAEAVTTLRRGAATLMEGVGSLEERVESLRAEAAALADRRR